MIGLDSNVILRFITQDDPVQSPIADSVFETRLTTEQPGFVSVVAMAETAWVLERRYRLTASALADALERILQIETLIVDHEEAVLAAVVAVRTGVGKFGDALIAALNEEARCERTLSFDRGALRLTGFEHP
jgi:predicted nucleic-acid-binding protein